MYVHRVWLIFVDYIGRLRFSKAQDWEYLISKRWGWINLKFVFAHVFFPQIRAGRFSQLIWVRPNKITVRHSLNIFSSDQNQLKFNLNFFFTWGIRDLVTYYSNHYNSQQLSFLLYFWKRPLSCSHVIIDQKLLITALVMNCKLNQFRAL